MLSEFVILLLLGANPLVIQSSSGKSLKKFSLSPAKELTEDDTKRSPSRFTFEHATPFWNNFEGFSSSLDSKLFNSNELFVEPICPLNKDTCDTFEHYRRIDGFCNNKMHPKYGSAHEVISRLLPPVYDKGVMRTTSEFGDLLPNPREVSNYLKLMRRRESTSHINILWLLFGQFVDHDFVFTPNSLEGKDESICSDCGSWRTTSACAPILVPKNDEFISPFLPDKKRKCLPFIRSAAIRSKYGEENTPALEQFNSNTAYLDLSTVYGSTSCKEKSLRLYHYGQMIEQKHPLTSEGMLPLRFVLNFKDCRGPGGKCPDAGDVRPVETLSIHLFHLIFLREHNRLAKELYLLNPHWTDETIFQEARRINIAKYQKIVYDEFLVLLLGKSLMNMYELATSKSSYYKGYDPEINSNVLAEFSTTAFRIGHTMVPDHIFLMNEFYFPKNSFQLRTLFRNATYLYKENIFEDMARGMMASEIEAVDPVIQSSIQDDLFTKNDNRFTSQDLISLNIARGRDHGIPGYTSYLNLCQSKKVNSWEDLEMDKDDVSVLKRVYSSVNDIDLFVGGLAEFPLDGLVGPTFGCIIAQQFLRSKKGDSFWFENKYNHLTTDQLESIREGSSLAKVLATNLNDISHLPNRIFNVPDKNRNPLLPTNSLRDINISLWREEKPARLNDCHYKGKTIQPEHIVKVSPCLRCYCNSENREITCTKFLEECSHYKNFDGYCRLVC